MVYMKSIIAWSRLCPVETVLSQSWFVDQHEETAIALATKSFPPHQIYVPSKRDNYFSIVAPEFLTPYSSSSWGPNISYDFATSRGNSGNLSESCFRWGYLRRPMGRKIVTRYEEAEFINESVTHERRCVVAWHTVSVIGHLEHFGEIDKSCVGIAYDR